jgi:hypothetical protein
MTTVVAEIKTVVSATRTAVAIVKKVDSSEALQKRFDESVQEVHRGIGQVSYAVSRALVAHALGRDPSHEEVNRFLEAAVNEASFPNRAFRLLGEARKSASRRRRAFLAAMLFGLPFSKLPDDERDRVDMVVERIMPVDIELLVLIADKDRTAKPLAPPKERYFFTGMNMVALTRGIEVRLVTARDYENRGFADQVEAAEVARPVDHAAFSSLQSLGCVEVAESTAAQGDWRAHTLVIAPLGRLMIQAIEELRPGFEGGIDMDGAAP